MNGMIRFGLILTLAACGGARQTQLPPVTATPSRPIAAPERPVPYPVVPPPSFRGAVDRGTRTTTGVPGESYWQQWADYEIDVRIDPAAHTISGTETVIYRNNSTDRLPQIFVHLYQNLHAPGAIRNESQEITGGIELLRVNADGHNSNYVVNGTHMAITLPAPLESGDTTTLQFTWRFQIPQSGAGRMGWNGDNLLYVGYWYPQVAVYDDVAGWHIDPYLGNAEFHNAFANYEYTVHAPDGWLVMGTGELTNAADALAPAVLERVRLAEISDDVVHVVTEADFGAVTAHSANGWVSWSFAADSVRDVAFSVTRASNWDAMRTPVGDVDGDGTADHARVDAIWRNSAPRWAQQVEYSRHSITFLSRYTGIPYPWPHMTAVEGGGIIGGGMEFPMMTLIGDYNSRGDSALYYVTAHEEAHMWIPMIVGTDEKRYAWMDEGPTTFHENQARSEYFPGPDHEAPDRQSYIRFSQSGNEGRMIRWTDYHRPGSSGVASYAKPATVLAALRTYLGEDRFLAAWRTFLAEWRYRYPKPWDFFNSIETSVGEELDWFWHSWYYETWTLNQAIASVEPEGDGWRITVRDEGYLPMPVYLTIVDSAGATTETVFGLEDWLRGLTTSSVTVQLNGPPLRVTLDAAERLPDVDREDNIWQAEEQ